MINPYKLSRSLELSISGQTTFPFLELPATLTASAKLIRHTSLYLNAPDMTP